MPKVKEPKVITKLFSNEDFENLKKIFNNPKSFELQESLSRWIVSNSKITDLNDYACKITPVARKIFNSDTLIPTYSLFAHYEGEFANLYKHKDNNACTYTIDMCVYQKYPWDLYVEGTPYTLYPNQALAYYGNDQEHWREEFPEKMLNYVAMIFFHFAEPDHWYFQKGTSYVRVIRNEITEDQWNKIGQ